MPSDHGGEKGDEGKERLEERRGRRGMGCLFVTFSQLPNSSWTERRSRRKGDGEGANKSERRVQREKPERETGHFRSNWPVIPHVKNPHVPI